MAKPQRFPQPDDPEILDAAVAALVERGDERAATLVREKWSPIATGFKPPPGWEGPFLFSPEQIAVFLEEHDVSDEPRWQIIFALETPDARNPNDPTRSGGVQAALAFPSLDDFLATPTDLLVRKMALSIAGRAAHEALEWVTMDGHLVVDPHGSAADMDGAAAYVREYLGNGATRE